MQLAAVWRALLTPPTDPGAQHTCEGLVPGSPTSSGLAAITRMAPPAAAANTATASAADPVEARTAASNFRLAMGVLHAKGCVCVYVFVPACVSFFGCFV